MESATVTSVRMFVVVRASSCIVPRKAMVALEAPGCATLKTWFMPG
jgi:hypothetical protein